ncbi:MAG: acetolactate synthase small subunit [Thermoguttaceae bacterium]|jgi:acetolactate synthase-1/3 small subunit|nr:acetolactate synthase small subunit [Thermoguttaceae bacterium]
MKNVLSIWVQNVPGVLSHVSGLLAARGYNVDSLTVGATDDKRFSRMTIVVDCDKDVMKQIELQLRKLVTVVDTTDLSDVPHVERELALICVEVDHGRRCGVLELVQIFRGFVVDVADKSLLVQITGEGAKIDAFIAALKPYKVASVTRSGCIAAPRGNGKSEESEEE